MTCSPSTLRNAACSRCVAEWLQHHRRAARRIDLRADAIADLQAPLSSGHMAMERPASFCVSRTWNAHAGVDELAGVADLAAAFGVERRAVEQHDGLLARA